MNKPSIWSYVSAPAPRYMLRVAVLENLFSKYIKGENQSFLEIGPGRGDLCHYLIDHPSIGYGSAIDISDKSIQLVKERIDFKKNFHPERIDLTSYRPKNRFDYICSFEVLEHVEDDQGFLNTIALHLNQNGLLFLSVPAYMRKWQKQDEYAGHIRRYEKNELIAKISNAKLDVLELIDYGFPLLNFIKPLKQIYYKKIPDVSKEELTKRSGVQRELFSHKLVLPYLIAYYPFVIIQYLFRNFSLGDGIIVVARKTS
jgi:2-polyprenyl-3-methyl-5-hydroxy-6-metoxy-1,4-benzoquinol methylase